MIPRISPQGTSFKNAAAYYLKDKEADTSNRVDWTHTENLPTDEPEMTWRFMAYTAMNAEELKRMSGASRRGAPSQKPVLTMSLSWAPGQEPTQEHMIDTMKSALAELGLQDHQALFIAHNDEEYKHVHVLLSLIHPETGLSASGRLAFSKEKLSKWAERYERETDGTIYCLERVENNKKRAQENADKPKRTNKLQAINEDRKRDRKTPVKTAKQARKEGLVVEKTVYARYKDPELAMRAEITRLYQATDSGKAFQAALKEAGLRLAKGRRIILIDREGKIHSLTRQIEGAKAKDVRARLADIDLESVADIRGQQRHEGGRENAEKARPGQKRQATEAPQAGTATSLPRQKPDLSTRLNRLYAKNTASLLRAKDRLEMIDAKLEAAYGERERTLRKELAQLEARQTKAGVLAKITGVFAKRKREIEHTRASLGNIEWRKSEARETLEKIIAQRNERRAMLGLRMERLHPSTPKTPRPAPAPEQVSRYQKRLASYRQQWKTAEIGAAGIKRTPHFQPANDFAPAANQPASSDALKQAREANPLNLSEGERAIRSLQEGPNLSPTFAEAQRSPALPAYEARKAAYLHGVKEDQNEEPKAGPAQI